MKQTQDVHVHDFQTLKTPAQVKAENPMNEITNETVIESRNVIKRMLRGKDSRLLVIVGPCSIHDPKAAYEYAERLAELSKEVNDQLFLVMRAYFEKPRTTVGWKGLINDPHLNGSSDIEYGLNLAREILQKITDYAVPVATEFLDPIVPQYISDLVTWAAIGARTTESQTHREMSSGLSMPVGYKNSTDGNMQIPIDAMRSARFPHRFLGVDQDGRLAQVRTSGNVWGHIILRGGHEGPNYEASNVETAVHLLNEHNLPPKVMIDCSHANSEKKHERQGEVWNYCIDQRLRGNENIFGMMIESHLHEGKQKIPSDMTELADPSNLKYGVSITDACISWETTEELIRNAYAKLKGAGVLV